MVSFGMRDLCKLNTLWVLANIAFTALLLVQLANILEGYIHPQTRHTWEKKGTSTKYRIPTCDQDMCQARIQSDSIERSRL